MQASYFWISKLLIKNGKIMLTTNDVAKVFDTILSIPGMNELVKIDLKISRKNVLLLNHVIERGLSAKEDEKGSSLLTSIPEENLQELKLVGEECLQKAGLIELSEKLNAFSGTNK
ncbi:hypothetical protein ACMDB5_09930 [Flavobacterium sp. W1B]|uniref:hypothetical protein n=1 Tax=Flavobacterium sp. W1B TaxID=3394146 RepID=UPI0039BD7EE0